MLPRNSCRSRHQCPLPCRGWVSPANRANRARPAMPQLLHPAGPHPVSVRRRWHWQVGRSGAFHVGKGGMGRILVWIGSFPAVRTEHQEVEQWVEWGCLFFWGFTETNRPSQHQVTIFIRWDSNDPRKLWLSDWMANIVSNCH